ncbi:hypothetical protein JTE90_027926 [Oedothorax gibbosus]|uniref:Uncharacterized protein n=1 Tax=Oedothorax gibbosus TaxID=931172 RepID=A0AAV6VGY2_9ARAC|nr:hypothetical protein JTE90_027926 [Oedothorax gibbosus]
MGVVIAVVGMFLAADRKSKNSSIYSIASAIITGRVTVAFSGFFLKIVLLIKSWWGLIDKGWRGSAFFFYSSCGVFIHAEGVLPSRGS